MDWWIDVSGGWRYSQAQIQDLVAYAIPRFSKAAQSLSSVARCARGFSAKSGLVAFLGVDPSGAKAHPNFVDFTARLKSCPFKTDESIFAGKFSSLFAGKFSSLTNFSAAGEVGAIEIDRIRRQITLTSQRRIGGYRNL